MENNKKVGKPMMIGIALLFIVALTAVGVFAMKSSEHRPMMDTRGFGNGFQSGNNTAVLTAIKANDYNAYMTALEDNWQTFKASMTQDRFNEIVKAYNVSSTRMQNVNLTGMHGKMPSMPPKMNGNMQRMRWGMHRPALNVSQNTANTTEGQ